MLMGSCMNGLSMKPWYLYVIRTACDRLYTGISTDVARRLTEHEAGRRGARALRARGPLELVYQAQVGERSLALKAEYRFKRLKREQKDQLLALAPDSHTLLRTLQLIGGDELKEEGPAAS